MTEQDWRSIALETAQAIHKYASVGFVLEAAEQYEKFFDDGCVSLTSANYRRMLLLDASNRLRASEEDDQIAAFDDGELPPEIIAAAQRMLDYTTAPRTA